MTMSVRLCLSYDPLKLDYIALKWTIFREENALLTRTLSVTLRIHVKELLHIWSYDFYDMTLSTDSNMALTFLPLSV